MSNNSSNSNKGFYKKDPVNVSKNANLSLYFPPTKNMDRLQITNVGIYSVSKPADAIWITQKILESVSNPKKLIITDATAAVGGNTINFANHFKSVNSIEMSEVHYNVLKNNVEVYGLKNVDIIHGDSLVEIPKIKQDVIFIDAPWSGTDYKKHKTMRLYMSGKPLPIIVNDFLKLASTIVLKVPYNFDFGNLFQNVQIEKYVIYKALKFRLIVISK
jgi:hypothetical protein